MFFSIYFNFAVHLLCLLSTFFAKRRKLSDNLILLFLLSIILSIILSIKRNFVVQSSLNLLMIASCVRSSQSYALHLCWLLLSPPLIHFPLSAFSMHSLGLLLLLWLSTSCLFCLYAFIEFIRTYFYLTRVDK